MSISTLSLAIAVLQQNDIRAIDVNKTHPLNYHVYYRAGGKNRVIVVPKECSDPMKLQNEIEVLVSRNVEEQLRLGALDGQVQRG